MKLSTDYQEQEGHERKIQKAMRVAVVHLQYISDFNITAAIETTTINNHNISTTNENFINVSNLDIGSIRRRISDISLAIKSGGTSLSELLNS